MIGGYKKTSIGLVPEDWSIVKLGNIANTFAGGTPNRNNKEYFDGVIPWVKSGEVNNRNIFRTEELVTEKAIKETATRLINPNSVLVALYGATAGNVGILRIEACSNQAVLAVCTKTDYVSNNYIYHWLKQSTKKLISLTQGSGQPNLNKNIVDSLIVAFPPLPEQSKIASILSMVDDKIDAIIEKLTQTQQFKNGLMQQLLTKGIGHTKFKDSPLGEIPERWRINRIGSLLKNKKGAMKIGPFGSQLKKNSMVDIGIKVYGQENIFKKDMSFGNRYVTEEHYSRLKSCELYSGDFIISMMGTIGKCMVVPEGIEKGIMDSHLIRLQLNELIMIPEFLSQFFSSAILLNQVNKLSHGGIMAGLSSSILGHIDIVCPPVDEQLKIAEILNTIDDKLYVLQNKKHEFENLKNGLMQQLLTGKVRVNINHES